MTGSWGAPGSPAAAPVLVGLLALAAAVVVLGAGAPRGRLAELGRRGGRGVRATAQPAGSGRRARVAWLSAGGRRGQLSAEAAGSVPSALALELRAGRGVDEALAAVAAEHEHLPEVARRLRAAAAAADHGADPTDALLGQTPQPTKRSSSPGAPDHLAALLRPTASCLSVGQRAGLPLADLLESTASAAHDSLELQALARAELAGARTSALLLAGLPAAGVGLGQLVGAAPDHFLLATPAGRICLAGAGALVAVGWAWTRALGNRLSRELAP